MKNNKGFSLVELIIVVAIMAVLMGILAPQYIRYVEKTRIRTDDSIVSEIDKACIATLAEEKFYKDAASAGVTITISNVGVVGVTGLPNTSADFLKEINTTVYGTAGAPTATPFKSKAYASATNAGTATYTFTSTLYTWQGSMTNAIDNSKFKP